MSATVSAGGAIACGIAGVTCYVKFFAAVAYSPVLGLVLLPGGGGGMVDRYFYFV